MKKKPCFFILIGVFISMIVIQPCGASLSITGVVKHPLQIDMEELNAFQSVSVKASEVMIDGTFRGVFTYCGVPLKTLLDMAYIEKEQTDFQKKIDLAIIVSGKENQRVVLSWGEVYYKNPGDFLVAFSATPTMPHKDCKACHKPGTYERWYKPLCRTVGLPKLVVSRDFYADRNLEEIVNIEVVDLKHAVSRSKPDKMFSPTFTISDEDHAMSTVQNLSGHPRVDVMIKEVGEGIGYHGIKSYSGASLAAILKKAGLDLTPDTAFILYAPDGYRSLLSYGELFLNPNGETIIIADQLAGRTISEGGAFKLVLPDDVHGDRGVKAINAIKAVHLTKKPKVYIIGLGCGDTSLITLEALSYLARADCLVCPKDLSTRFGRYLMGKPVLFDPLETIEQAHKQKASLSHDEMEKLLRQHLKRNVDKITAQLEAGHTVGVLDWGDPTIFGSSDWVSEYFKPNEVEIVGSLSAFNAANAAIARDIGCNGRIVITDAKGLRHQDEVLAAIARNGDTIAIFMGLKGVPELVKKVMEFYPPSTPACVVYKAGYSHEEKIIRTTLDKLVPETQKEQEKWLGMIYIGPCLASRD